MHFEIKSNVENGIGVSKKAIHRNVGDGSLNREGLAGQNNSDLFPFGSLLTQA